MNFWTILRLLSIYFYFYTCKNYTFESVAVSAHAQLSLIVVFLYWGVLEHIQATAQIPENPNTRDATGMAVLASPFYFLGGRNPPPLFVVMFC